MRSLILGPLFACGGGRRLISRSINSGRMLMSSSSSSPWLMLPPGRDSSSGNIIHNLYSLAEQKHLRFDGGFALEDGTRFVGSSHGWLALFNARNDNHLFLTNPLSRRRIHLPPVHELDDPEINLRNGRATVSKVILSCSPDDDDDWRALMAFGPGNRLALCSDCDDDGSRCWTSIGDLFHRWVDPYERYARSYEDFVYCRPGKSFICSPLEKDRQHCTEYWFDNDHDCLESPALTSICRPPWAEEIPEELAPRKARFCVPHLVFVEHQNQLLYVVRFVSGKRKRFTTFGFAVFRVENDHGLVNRLRWLRPDQGDSLEGLAIFVGIGHSFAVAAADFPNIKPDSIYFTHSNWNFTSPDSVHGCHDIGIFDFQTGSVSPCCYYPSPSQVEGTTHPPLWFTPTPY